MRTVRTTAPTKQIISKLPSASEMTYIVSGGALNSTHSLIQVT